MSLSPVRTAENLTLTWMFADREACQIWFLGQPDDDADDDMRLHFFGYLFISRGQRRRAGMRAIDRNRTTAPLPTLMTAKDVLTNQSVQFSVSMHQLMRVTTACGGETQ